MKSYQTPWPDAQTNSAASCQISLWTSKGEPCHSAKESHFGYLLFHSELSFKPPFNLGRSLPSVVTKTPMYVNSYFGETIRGQTRGCNQSFPGRATRPQTCRWQFSFQPLHIATNCHGGCCMSQSDEANLTRPSNLFCEEQTWFCGHWEAVNENDQQDLWQIIWTLSSSNQLFHHPTVSTIRTSLPYWTQLGWRNAFSSLPPPSATGSQHWWFT